MKKTTLLLSFIITALVAHSQEVYRAYEAGIATFSNDFNVWIYGPAAKTNLTFLLQHKILLVNDAEKSTYILGDQFQDDLKSDVGMLAWNAVDQDGKKCSVKLIFRKSGPVKIEIAILYGSSSYYYHATGDSK